MAPIAFPLRVRRKLIRWAAWTALVCGSVLMVLVSGTAPRGRHSAEPGTNAWAQDLAFSARVDKTTVNIGDPINLTLTLSGDVSDVQLPTPEFPEGFAIVARSQSTNFTIRAGATERSTSLVYVLVPQQAGTFHIGPFGLKHHNKEVQTEAIEITVKKPAVPPHLPPQGERFTL